MKLAGQIEGIFKTNTLRHFSITTLGTAINGFLGLLFYIVVARALGPESYGILAVAVASITLLADIADLGIDTTLLRFVSKYRRTDETKALKFIKLGFRFKFLAWMVILIFGWILAPQVAQAIFLKPELIDPLRLSLVGVGGAMLFSLTIHIVQAYEKFWSWSFINISLNGIRLLAVISLIYFGLLNSISTLWLYMAFPFIGFFLTLFFLPNFFRVKGEGETSQDFFHYSKWVALVGILAATGSRLDTFISTRILSVAEVGIYSAAVQLSIVIPQLVFALATVVAPKLSSMDTDIKAIAYLKKLQLLVVVMFVGGVLISPLAFIVIPLIFGPSYVSSITPFLILLFAQLIFLLALPSHQAIYYYFSKPNIFSYLSAGQLVITGIAGWFLISAFGIVGAALTVFINNLFGLIIPGIWVIYKFKRGGKIEKNNLGTHIS